MRCAGLWPGESSHQRTSPCTRLPRLFNIKVSYHFSAFEGILKLKEGTAASSEGYLNDETDEEILTGRDLHEVYVIVGYDLPSVLLGVVDTTVEDVVY